MLQSLRDRLPSRVIIAWAILGAAAAISLMYSKHVFDSDIDNGHTVEQDGLHIPVISYSGLVRTTAWVRIGGSEVYRDDWCEEWPADIVDRWHLRVATVLGLVGALFGLAAWRLCRPIRAEKKSIDVRLWGVLTLMVFCVLAGFGIPGEMGSLRHSIRLTLYLQHEWGMPWRLDDFEHFATVAVRPAIIAIVVGWAGQTVLCAYGIRWPLRRTSDQAADYDDRFRSTSPTV